LALRIEQHGAVHLTREADGADALGRHLALGQRLSRGLDGGLPPVGRILLGPGRAGRSKGYVGRRGRGHDRTRVVDDEGPRPTRPDIDTEDWNDRLPRNE